AALISCRQSTSGCSRSMRSCSSAWRARMPFTFHVTIFIGIRAQGSGLRLEPGPGAVAQQLHVGDELAAERIGAGELAFHRHPLQLARALGRVEGAEGSDRSAQ